MTKIYVYIQTPAFKKCFMVIGKYGFAASGLVLSKLAEIGFKDDKISDWVFDFFRSRINRFSGNAKFGKVQIYISRTIPLEALYR